MTALTRNGIMDVYRRRARNYDLTANLYYLIGFREFAYRRRAIDALGLRPGDTVVDVGCGTGLNFRSLRDAVGGEGTVIGVDLTDAMLEQANERIAKHGWTNVRTVHSDATEFAFPTGVAGILSSFALTLIRGFDDVIARGAKALRPGGRWVVLDFKEPGERWQWLMPLAVQVMKPFAVTRDLTERHPWESIERHLGNLEMTELYGGFGYIASGRSSQAAR